MRKTNKNKYLNRNYLERLCPKIQSNLRKRRVIGSGGVRGYWFSVFHSDGCGGEWRSLETLILLSLTFKTLEDPGWVGTVALVFYNVVRAPEVIAFIVGVLWLTYLHYKPKLPTPLPLRFKLYGSIAVFVVFVLLVWALPLAWVSYDKAPIVTSSTESIEFKRLEGSIRGWLDNLHYWVREDEEHPEKHFSFTVKGASPTHVEVMKLKKIGEFIIFASQLDFGSTFRQYGPEKAAMFV